MKFEKTFVDDLSKDQLLVVVRLLQKKWFAASPVAIKWGTDKTVSFIGKGFSGFLGIEQNKLWLELELSLILKPLQNKIRQSIQRELEALQF